MAEFTFLIIGYTGRYFDYKVSSICTKNITPLLYKLIVKRYRDTVVVSSYTPIKRPRDKVSHVLHMHGRGRERHGVKSSRCVCEVMEEILSYPTFNGAETELLRPQILNFRGHVQQTGA
jgi:hypothetical protein